MTATFAFAKFGENGAHILSRDWCRRSQWWYDMWAESGSRETFTYAGHADPPAAPQEFQMFARHAGGFVLARVNEVLALRPQW